MRYRGSMKKPRHRRRDPRGDPPVRRNNARRAGPAAKRTRTTTAVPDAPRRVLRRRNHHDVRPWPSDTHARVRGERRTETCPHRDDASSSFFHTVTVRPSRTMSIACRVERTLDEGKRKPRYSGTEVLIKQRGDSTKSTATTPPAPHDLLQLVVMLPRFCEVHLRVLIQQIQNGPYQ